MNTANLNTINNVFLSVGDNSVKLAEIFFTDKIVEINYLSDKINWNEIDTIDKRNDRIKQLHLNNSSNSTIDGNFNILIPGGIDSHVHFNTPGFELREDFEHASTAAAWGGVTTVIDMPCTSIPPVTSTNNLEAKLNSLKNKSVVDFALWGGVSRNAFDSNQNIEEQIIKLSEAGVVGFKAYLISGMQTFADLNFEQMNVISKYIKNTSKPLAVHAEDKFMVESRRLHFKETNRNTWRQYCLARDVFAEEKAVKQMIEIAKGNNAITHIVHLSSKLALHLIQDAKKQGIPISTETCPHYLYFTQNDFLKANISNYLKTAPPVKFDEDKDALWQGLADGAISFVVTDHAGSIPERDKSSDNFWDVYGGIPGVEHRIPFLFSEGFKKDRLTLQQTIDLLSSNIAKYFKLKNKGEITNNYDADFALINLWDNETVKSQNMHSKGKYTPFENTTFNAVVEKTWLRGNLISDRDNEIPKNYYGQFIRV